MNYTETMILNDVTGPQRINGHDAFLYVLGFMGAFLVASSGKAQALGFANERDSQLCTKATSQVERATRIPDGFLTAISRVETGRSDRNGKRVAWPWTINVDGHGHYYDTRYEAIAAARHFMRTGHKSIDLGCMQINTVAHPFPTLGDAFDPYENARFSGEFLMRMKEKTGSWPRAAAAYHSQIEARGNSYMQRVLDEWSVPDRDRTPLVAPQKSLSPTPAIPATSLHHVATTQKFRKPDGKNVSSSIPLGRVMTGAMNQGVVSNPGFRPYRGNFRFNTAILPTRRFKGNTGRSLSDYKRNTVRRTGVMPQESE